MIGRLSPAELEARLAACRHDYDAIKARIADIGFICEGSLVERWTSCGKPNCRCVDPAQRHGPYYQLSWKTDRRTISRRLTAAQADLYREWIANRRQLETLVDELKSASDEARQLALGAITEPAVPAETPRPRT